MSGAQRNMYLPKMVPNPGYDAAHTALVSSRRSPCFGPSSPPHELPHCTTPGLSYFPRVVFAITSSLADIVNSTAYYSSSLYSQVQIVIRLAGTGAVRGHGDVVHAAHPNDDPCTRTVVSPRFMDWNEIGIFSQPLFRPVQVPYVL